MFCFITEKLLSEIEGETLRLSILGKVESGVNAVQIFHKLLETVQESALAMSRQRKFVRVYQIWVGQIELHKLGVRLGPLRAIQGTILGHEKVTHDLEVELEIDSV